MLSAEYTLHTVLYYVSEYSYGLSYEHAELVGRPEALVL